jgi:hypothetical protein
MNICLKCSEVFNKEHNFNKCPKLECGGKVIWVDDLYVEIISILNAKGYETLECCSSHIYNWDMEEPLSAYISFNDYYDFKDIPENFIKEFHFKVDGSEETVVAEGVVLRQYFMNTDYLDTYDEILASASRLFKWAMVLPIWEDEEV